MNRTLLPLTFATVCLITITATAENWAGWRGPRGDGTSVEKNVPVKWNGKTATRKTNKKKTKQ